MAINIQKAVKKMVGKSERTGNIISTQELNLHRKFRRIEKIANRIRRNKARPEEIEIFEALKKKVGIKEVWFNNYDREWVFE